MTLPAVTITKTDGNTGVTKPALTGIIALIAPASSGTANAVSVHTSPARCLAEFGYGKLSEFAAYLMQTTGKQVVCIRPTASTAGTYGSITEDGEGTSAVTAGSTEPNDDLDIVVKFVDGGTRGTTGITYRESIDGGLTFGPVLALGVATSILVTNTGATINLGAGTILADQTASFSVVGPKMTNANLVTALEALRVANVPWECVYPVMDATSAEITTLDGWLSGLESTGKFRHGFLSSRMKNSGESESTYRTAMQAAFGQSASIRMNVGTDGGDLASPIRGITRKRPAMLAIAARCMKIDIGRDPAAVADGPVNGFILQDASGNPNNHNEAFYPGLDDLRLCTLRTFDDREGTFITNAPCLSATGSDYVYVQHARIANAMCEKAFSLLTTRLSSGVTKNPTTGKIDVSSAEDIDAYVNGGLEGVAKNRTSAFSFAISRDDDISSNAGAVLTGTINVVPLAYVKGFEVSYAYRRTLTAAAA